ncbi:MULTISPECIES: sigma factor-like helix-turn-helix DNA-binding protein [Paenibacillus]|uniref:sigma factor-like helix-turn-helix DNA-binding protein n=1 Tax=Paenibacillus TaxID=44249 RepID=UPI00037BBFBA|nr:MULTISPECIES: sigma factor-like helix-turn-helix DNA-binding protein [Paenibacillus]
MNPVLCTYEECLVELKRSAWRLQSKTRAHIKRECEWAEDYNEVDSACSQLQQLCEEEFIQYALSHISSSKARLIIQKLYVEDLSEKQVAEQLNLTQQAVNRWKNKALQELRSKKNLLKYVQL